MQNIWDIIKDYLINTITDPSSENSAWQPKSVLEYLTINQNLAKIHGHRGKAKNIYLYSPWSSNRIYSVLPYQEQVVKELIAKLKFENNDAATLVATKLLTLGINELMRIHALSNVIVVPAPSSAGRRRDKGFDQCLNIAKKITESSDCASFHICYLLQRRGWLLSQTPTQHTLARNERFKNTKSAFKVDRKCLTNLESLVTIPNRLQNCAIVIFDDVTTTGSTLSACIEVVLRELKTAPDLSGVPVFGIALAH